MTGLRRVLGLALAAGLALCPGRAAATQLVSVSADVVEISGSLEDNVGFSWNQLLQFGETSIPGIIAVGDFARQTALSTQLRALETEGKAQTLANPKIVTKSGATAQFTVGGQIPYPVVNAQQVSTEFKPYGVTLNIAPTIQEDRKDVVNLHVQLSVSAPDSSQAVVVGNTTVPALTSRQVETEVEIKNGETLVIGGLKQSDKNIARTRIPILGYIPILGKLFETSDVKTTDDTLFLFLTVEILQ